MTDPKGLDAVSFNDHFNYFVQSPTLIAALFAEALDTHIMRPVLATSRRYFKLEGK
jgi:hypothetical protein